MEEMVSIFVILSKVCQKIEILLKNINFVKKSKFSQKM